ncbi:MAG: DUF4292 domain-containing protein [Spirochaetes bacterium]|nr:DUF4292 domain-containing protein [Spirochaetota bacterium]
MRKFILLFFSLLILVSCKTIPEKDKEITGNILFKNLINEAQKVENFYINGALKITGVKDIPPGYVNFESQGNFATQETTFRISFLNYPIIDILFSKNDILLVNYTNNQYIKLNVEEVDLASLLGINFNPNDIGYFLLGKIPYTKDMQLMNFNIVNDRYYIELTNASSKYDIYLNENQEIVYAKSESQFFDPIVLDTIKYIKNDDNVNIPKNALFKSLNQNDQTVAFSFIIKNISYQDRKSFFQEDLINDFTEISDINEMKIQLR